MAYTVMLGVHVPVLIFIAVAVMGLGYASLYASILCYGIDQRRTSDPKLMTFFVLLGTVGNIVALPLSSLFVHLFSLLSALVVGLAMLGLVLVLVFATLYDSRNPALNKRKWRVWGAISRRTKVWIRKPG